MWDACHGRVGDEFYPCRFQPRKSEKERSKRASLIASLCPGQSPNKKVWRPLLFSACCLASPRVGQWLQSGIGWLLSVACRSGTVPVGVLAWELKVEDLPSTLWRVEVAQSLLSWHESVELLEGWGSGFNMWPVEVAQSLLLLTWHESVEGPGSGFNTVASVELGK